MEFCIQSGQLIGLQRGGEALELSKQRSHTVHSKRQKKKYRKTIPLFWHIVENRVNYAHIEVW